METKQGEKKQVAHSGSSYPTYEEWKLGVSSSIKLNLIRSYPTYEEWKPNYRAYI